MTRRRLVAALAAVSAVSALSSAPAAAYADGGAECDRLGSCYGGGRNARDSRNEAATARLDTRKVGHGSARPVRNRAAERAAAIQRQFQREVAVYKAALAKQQACAASLHPVAGQTPASWCAAPKRPTVPKTTLGFTPTGGGPAAPVVPTVTPEQAAYMAVAQLQLPANAPGIGPDPAKNEWHMAVVGYPLWLWADGNTHVGPVAEAVANLSVSLDARISKTVFTMGDGQEVTCAGGGKPYASWVQPGAESPSCGYSYTKPSLPDGKYTVTATTTWAVTWTVNGATGVIDVPRQASVQLPVGELQAVIVR